MVAIENNKASKHKRKRFSGGIIHIDIAPHSSVGRALSQKGSGPRFDSRRSPPPKSEVPHSSERRGPLSPKVMITPLQKKVGFSRQATLGSLCPRLFARRAPVRAALQSAGSAAV